MVEIITIEDYKKLIKNTELNNISDESIQTSINITTLTLDSICGSQISKRWPLDETNRLHLTQEQKEYIKNAFILQTKYVLDNNIDFSIGSDQMSNGSSSWSQTRLKREQVLPEVLQLLQSAGVYYVNDFVSLKYEKQQNNTNNFYDLGQTQEDITPITVDIGDKRYVPQYNPNAKRKWLFSDEKGQVVYTDTNPEALKAVKDVVINGNSVVDKSTNIATFEMIKDITNNSGVSLVDKDTHIATIEDYIKTDLSNNPNNLINGLSLYTYNVNHWEEHIKIPGSTTGAPIKLNENGYKSGTDKVDTKYHCLSIVPDTNNIIDFKINSQEMWNTVAFPLSTNFNITANDSNSDLISKVYDSSGKFVNTLTFNIAPNKIFEQNKQLLKKYVQEHMTYGVNNTTYTELNLNTDGYFLTHIGDNGTNNYVAPSDGTLKVKVRGTGENYQAWVMYDVNGYNGAHYNCPAVFGEAFLSFQVRQGDKVYLKGYAGFTWDYIRFFANEWRFND